MSLSDKLRPDHPERGLLIEDFRGNDPANSLTLLFSAGGYRQLDVDWRAVTRLRFTSANSLLAIRRRRKNLRLDQLRNEALARTILPHPD